LFSYSKGYYVPPPIDQCLKFKNHCSLVGTDTHRRRRHLWANLPTDVMAVMLSSVRCLTPPFLQCERVKGFFSQEVFRGIAKSSIFPLQAFPCYRPLKKVWVDSPDAVRGRLILLLVQANIKQARIGTRSK
jgi:hypothetical protein